jgi:hypothetical protein
VRDEVLMVVSVQIADLSVWLIHYTQKYFPFFTLEIGIFILDYWVFESVG